MLVYTVLPPLHSLGRVPVGWGGVVRTVIIVSNQTTGEVVLSCIEVVVGVLTICHSVYRVSQKMLVKIFFGQMKFGFKIVMGPKNL